ncbi:MAG: hypothetical protein A2Z04_01885 [Chloroflexi bacterium RBG_16_57_9]|nr:MAG: hypothetical protein A2Z04_01885 [Chloroflexi bacterium RBG_16_57_9]
MLRIDPQDKEILVDPLFKMGRGFYLIVGVLGAIVAWGVFTYARQIIFGLGVTGMQRPAYWGAYMVNFVFFIGISHAGTLISAILRVTQAEWRRPITRIAEAITVFALVVGTLQIFFDLGRPERMLYLFIYGRPQSPLLWDAMSVTAYFLGSVSYLFMPLIPDLAIVRDNMPATAPRWRKIFYNVLSLGWRGNRTQWVRLEKAIAVMAILIIPIAVSVHTIISWILATTVQPGWHSTIFGPYFVVGAIFSGIGALFVAMAIARKLLKLEAYITEKQFTFLSYLQIAMTAIWFYFTFAEHLTLAAGQQGDEFPILLDKLFGEYAGGFWLMVVCMIIAFWILLMPRLAPAALTRVPIMRARYAIASVFIGFVLSGVTIQQPEQITAAIPLFSSRLLGFAIAAVFFVLAGISALPWLKRNIVGSTVLAALPVLLGMWLERWNIVVPTLTHPRLIPYSFYIPSETEISLTIASFALFALMFVLFFKLFPPISIWEVAEGRVIDQAKAEVHLPLPEVSAVRRLRRFGLPEAEA